MSNVIIIYAGRHGQTRKIAARIADRLREEKHGVELYDAMIRIDPSTLENADAILIGSAVQMGKHLPEIHEFVSAHRELLKKKPSAFFSVSMAASRDTDEAHKEVAQSLSTFTTKTGWDPPQIGVFAGALKYRSYWFGLRFVMKQIAKKNGGATDTSKDHEYTNWGAVDTFAKTFAARIRAKERPRDAAPKLAAHA